jgi:hypothetical protein
MEIQERARASPAPASFVRGAGKVVSFKEINKIIDNASNANTYYINVNKMALDSAAQVMPLARFTDAAQTIL